MVFLEDIPKCFGKHTALGPPGQAVWLRLQLP